MPAVVDLAAMRDTCKRLGGDPDKINPLVPVDLVIDHSVQVDEYGSNHALDKNLELEMQRNAERFTFLKWGANAFKGLTIVPPGAGIVHQVLAPSFRVSILRCGRGRDNPHNSQSVWVILFHSLVTFVAKQFWRHVGGVGFSHFPCACRSRLPPSYLRLYRRVSVEVNYTYNFLFTTFPLSFRSFFSPLLHLQVNLEYLGRCVFKDEAGVVYPDSVVGTDSHTPMINGTPSHLSCLFSSL